MTKTITLTKVHNVFDHTDRDIFVYEYIPGQSLATLKEALPQGVSFAVSLNAVTIPEERLQEVFPRPGDSILFVPILTGSDGKQIARIAALVAVMAVAPYAGGALFGSAGVLGTSAIGAAIVAGSVMVLGGILINNLLPPPKPDQETLGNNYNRSNSYSWNPQTLQQQGVSIPRWYGKNKIYGNLIGGYLTSNGDTQNLNALVDLGVGPFKNIPSEWMKINDQPIANFQSAVTAPEVRYGHLRQTTIQNFQQTIVEHSLSQIVTLAASPYIYTPSGNSYDGLEVEITFPSGLYSINTTTGAHETQKVELKIELVKGATTINLTLESTHVDLVNSAGWSLGHWIDIKPDATNTDGFTGQAWKETTNGNDRYAYAYQLYDEGAQTTSTVWTPYHTEGEIDPTTGEMWHFFGTFPDWWDMQNKAENDATTEVAPIVAGSGIIADIYGDESKVLRRKWRIYGLAHGTWDVKVYRITADNSSQTLINDFYVTAVREVTAIPFTYPRHVLIGINALATDTLSGSLRFSAICECLMVRVYESGYWYVKYSNNPAWVLYDLLTLPVYSSTDRENHTVLRYDGVPPSRLDTAKFVEWAAWCDELVPDGSEISGQTEKRITFNGGFDSEVSLWDAALQVCQIGNAMLIWNGMKLTLAIDKPSDPVQLFSVGNTGVDSFSESFISMEDRAAEIEVDFVNSENDYKRDKVSFANDNITTIVNKVGIQLFGVTKSSEAWRYAQRRLAYNQYLSRTVSFSADVDAIACTIGDVILLQNDVPQWGFGGRLVSATTTSVTLDQNVTIAPATSYTVMIRNSSSDAIIERAITNAPGITDTLTFTSPISPAPSVYDLYAFGITDLEAKPFKIINLQPTSDQRTTITCIEYNANVYAMDEGTPIIPDINYSALSLAPWPTFTNLTLVEKVVKLNGGGDEVSILASYDAIDDARFPRVLIWLSPDNANFKFVGSYITNEPALIPAKANISYRVLVRAVNSIGEMQPVASCTLGAIATDGQTVPPANVAGFDVVFLGDCVTLTWTANTEYDLAGYELRYGASWEAGTLLFKMPKMNFLRYRPTVAETVTFWIKAYDTSGNYSATAASDSVTTEVLNINNALIQVGGRNLALNSDVVYTNTNYNVCNPVLSEQLVNGRVYTMTIKGSLTGGQQFGLWMNGGIYPLGFFVYDSATATYKLTFTAGTPNSGQEYNLNIYNTPGGSTSSTVTWHKVELGNVATDWSPAPEDIQTQLDGFANDAMISPGVERKFIFLTWKNYYDEKSGIDAQADAYNITTLKTTYNTKWAALQTYLNASPISMQNPPTDGADWTAYKYTIDIVPATYKARFNELWVAKQALLNEIAAIAGTLATWSSVSGTGKPADNATVGATWGVNIDGSNKPADNATVGATWGTDVNSRPSNLSSLTGTEDITNDKLGTGANLVQNSNFQNASYDGWTFSPVNSSTVGVNLSADWTLKGGNTAYINQPNGTTTGYSYLYTEKIIATAGQKFEYFVYTGAHRCTVYTYLNFYNSSDGDLGNPTIASNPEEASGGTLLSGYKKTGDFATAPANSAYCRLIIRKGATYSGQADSYAFASLAFVGVAGANQTVLSPWSPAMPTVRSLGFTGALDATHNTGALADLNTVSTTVVDSEAITKSVIATAGNVAPNADTETELIRLTFAPTVAPAAVMCRLFTIKTGNNSIVTIRLYRDTTLKYEKIFTMTGGEGFPVMVEFPDTSPSASSVEYIIKVIVSVASAFSSSILTVQGFKK